MRVLSCVRRGLAAIVVVVAMSPVAGASLNTDCGAVETARHTDPSRTRIWSTPSGVASLLFIANLDVNTDGAGRSYHPRDPRGKTLALNNIANATSSIHAADGSDLACSPIRGECFERYIRTFEAARDAGWASTGAPQWRSNGMIPWRKVSGRATPCIADDGPFKGYFVSATAFPADITKGPCDQARYLDSLAFNAIVLPKATPWAAAAGNGDLAVVRDLDNGITAFAVVGDRGPRHALGEGTIALAAKLSQATLAGNETYAQVRKLARANVLYLVLRGQGIRQRVPGALTQELLDQHVKAAYEAWGGEARLTACRATMQP
jgi:hypothetical protein